MIFKTKPYQHQLDTVTRFQHEEYGAIFAEQGLGKTKIMLDIIANSRSGKGNVLILAPNGLHANWYYKEMSEHLPESEHWATYYWKGPPRAKSKEHWRLQSFLKPNENGGPKMLFMNIEAIRTPNGMQVAERFLSENEAEITTTIIDESTCIKNPKAQVTKAAWKLATLSDRRFILTGTPMTQGPLDLYAQIRFLSFDATPYKTWTSFKTAFAIEETKHFGPRAVRCVTGYRNLDRLTEIMKPFSIRLTKEEALDLPEKVWHRQFVEMEPKQKRAYQDLKEHALAVLDSEVLVSSTIPLTTIMKLQQICSGFVKDDEGVVHRLPSGKIKALLQVAESTQPLVIFCAFRENVDMIREALEEEHGRDCCSFYMGGMDNEQRTKSVQDFQSGTTKFFITTSAGAKGLTLTRASTLVYYSCDFKLETRLQSQDRIHRIGQANKCTYIDLVCPESIDLRILEALDGKRQLSDMVLDDLIELIKSA